mgnify:CR=1 FL=1
MNKLPAREGWNWVKQGFALFRKQPLGLAALFFGYVLVTLALGLVPLVGKLLSYILIPMFTVAFMQGCADAEQGKRVHPGLLLTGFRSPAFASLVQLGLVYMALAVLAIAASALIDGGVWLHIGAEHHVMALVDKGYSHFHHLALDTVDIGQMRDALDHLGRHGRWLGWGPTRHGVGGNIASYVRVVEEPCFVELYCDMELLEPGHEPRTWPDNRSSSNTWGPLPPRSYFRFDDAAVASERESLEMQGVPLADPVNA